MLVVIIAAIVAVVLVLSLEALAVMWLWNYLTPEVLPMTDISFWQAMALSVLCSLLFGNIAKSTVNGADSKKASKQK